MNRKHFFEQLQRDISVLRVSGSLMEIPLFHDSPIDFDVDHHPSLWSRFILQPALDGTLFQPSKQKRLFLEAFLKIGDEIWKEQSVERMFGFIQSYMDGETQSTNLARLLVLGNGGAGKTSLVSCIHENDPTHNAPATPKIDVSLRTIEPKDAAQKNTELSIWDFGGQVIMHSTHHFFISRKSLYLIVCNQRANEQPDAWLDMIVQRAALSEGKKVNAIVLYTHCEKGVSKHSFKRDSALNRKYRNLFDLQFESVDLFPQSSTDLELDGLRKKIDRCALEQGSQHAMHDVLTVPKQFSEETPYLTVKELIRKLSESGITLDWPLLKEAINYGFIFPEKPLSTLNIPKDTTDFTEHQDVTLIQQKHWLTYGTFSLINNQAIQSEHGLITQTTLEAALSLDQRQYVDAAGRVFNDETKPDDDQIVETLRYDKAGAELLKNVILNYGWGIRYHNRNDQILLPLATPLDEPYVIGQPYEDLTNVSDGEDCQYTELVFEQMPKDFFFKLMTYVDVHLKDKTHLWRTGVVLHYMQQENTVAVFSANNTVLTLKVQGQHAEEFFQLLLLNIKSNIRSYEQDSMPLTVYSQERIQVGDEEGVPQYQMVDSRLMMSMLDNKHDLLTMMEKVMAKKGGNTIINVKGNVNGGLAGKDYVAGNKIKADNVQIINQFQEKLPSYINDLSKHADKSGVGEVIDLLKQAQTEPAAVKHKGFIPTLQEKLKAMTDINKGIESLQSLGQTIGVSLGAIAM